MRLKVRDRSWLLGSIIFVLKHYRTLILSCYVLLVAYWVIRDLPVEIRSTIARWLLVPSLLSVVCLTGLLYIIKSVKRRPAHPPAPEFLKLSDEMVHSIYALVNGRVMRLNKRQCLDLSSKLSQTMQNIQKLERLCGSSNSVFRPSLEHLYQVLVKAHLLVNECCNENWIRTSVFQIQNESAFQVILMDVGFCYHAIYEQAKLSGSAEWKNLEVEDLRDSSTFKPASVTDVHEDREELREKLVNLVDARKYGSGWLFQVYYFLLVRLSKKLRLAEYLLVKLHCITQQPLSDGLQLSKQLIWTEESYSSLTWGREVPLGVGSGASGVCKTKWLSVPCAKKCNIPEPYFLKEAGILSHVYYPNIIKFICCGEKSEFGDDFIALELMEMSLSDLIKEKGKKGIPFSYDVAVDIVAQIARGMCYLHGGRVAHRDLKPANVILNVLTSPYLEGAYHVKLVDFGTSKTEVDPLKTTSTEHGFGTLTHKAPEVRHLAPAKSEGDRKWRAVWFKADVWSFAIICLEILSLKLRKSLGDEDEDLKFLFRTGCPRELGALLEDCLEANPRSRPDFLEVCSRLEDVRHRLLRQLSNSDRDSLSASSSGCSHDEFIEMRLEEHFHRQNAGVVADGEEVEVLISQASHVEQRANQESSSIDPGSSIRQWKIDRNPETWTRQPGNEVFRKALEERQEAERIHMNNYQRQAVNKLRIDPGSSIRQWKIDRNLETWTRQPGNEVFRKALEERQEAERIHMNNYQRQVVNKLRWGRTQFHLTFILSVHIVCEVRPQRMHEWHFLVLLETFFIVCWTIDRYRCFWRLRNATVNDLNKHLVILRPNIFEMLKELIKFFFIEDDVEYDPSSNSPRKLTWLLLQCVDEVFRMLLLSICSMIFLK